VNERFTPFSVCCARNCRLAVISLTLLGCSPRDRVAGGQGAASRNVPAASTAVVHVPAAWDSPYIAELEKEADRRLPPLPPIDYSTDQATRNRAIDAMVNRLQGHLVSFAAVLREKLTADQLGELVDSFATMPLTLGDAEPPPVFTCALWTYETPGAVNRDGIVKLLSVYCPLDAEFHTTIEYHLAETPGIGDPVQILLDAYHLSRSNAARDGLACAFRRAFYDQGIKAKSDQAFVEAAAAWYQQHKDALVISDNYQWDYGDELALIEGADTGARPGPYSLFKLRSGGK
jgi:hypothetical protein